MENYIQKDLFRDYITEVSELPQCRNCGEIAPSEYFSLMELKEDAKTFLTCICVSCAAKKHMLNAKGELKKA